MIEGFICEKCNTPFLYREDAIRCENMHKVPIQIGNWGYSKASIGHNGQPCPTNITVRFSEKHGDYATYMFSHYGAKGV